MITLYGFGRGQQRVVGEVRDLRAQWALEETGLPYRVLELDHAGELDSVAFSPLSLRQVPVIEDDGFVVAEAAAALLYLAEKSGKLIPADLRGRTQVIDWCFAPLGSVEWPLMQIALIDLSGPAEDSRQPRAELAKRARRSFGELERRLDGRHWIACGDFTVADILLASVLREVRKTDLLDPYPRLKAYYGRALARPAWQRTLAAYAERLGLSAADMR
jgi:glutathione S-transferase